MKFFGDGRAAGLLAPFENQRLESGFGQVKRGDQPVVSAADDDDVARCRPWLRCSLSLSESPAPTAVPARP